MTSIEGANKRKIYFGVKISQNQESALQGSLIFVIISIAYISTAFVIDLALNGKVLNNFFMYLEAFYIAYAICIATVLVFRRLVLALSTSRPELRSTADRIFALDRDRLPEIVPILIVFPFYLASFTSIKNNLVHLGVFSWDAALADLDRILHFGVDPWRIVNPLLSDAISMRAIQWIYAAWGVIMTYSILAVAIWEPERRRRLQFYSTYFLLFPILGNFVAWIFYSAGPAFLLDLDPSDKQFEALNQFLAGFSNIDYSAYDFQRYLWTAHKLGLSHFGTGISAFPSMHVAIAMLVFLAGYRRNRVAMWGGALFLVAIQIGSVHLGWHYAVDGYASILFTIAIWWLSGQLIQWGAALQSRMR